jgi:IS4 transposase
LVTTLLDPVAYPAAELAQLYLRRWSVELFFRHIKTTLQMKRLRCLSPALLHREVLLHLIAYNLIRGIMAEAAAIYDQDVAFFCVPTDLTHALPLTHISETKGSVA